jgi:hypothetical protein
LEAAVFDLEAVVVFLLSRMVAIFIRVDKLEFRSEYRARNPSGFFRFLRVRPKSQYYRTAVSLLQCDEIPPIVHDHGPLVAIWSKQKEL